MFCSTPLLAQGKQCLGAEQLESATGAQLASTWYAALDPLSVGVLGWNARGVQECAHLKASCLQLTFATRHTGSNLEASGQRVLDGRKASLLRQALG